jgi:ATP-binding cassette subfamily B protein
MIRMLGILAAGNGRKLAVLSLISVLEAFFGFVPFVVLYFIMVEILEGRLDAAGLLGFIAVVIAGASARMLLCWLNVIVGRRYGTLMIRDLRLLLGEHIRRLPLTFFSRHDIGELSHRILEHVNRVEMIVTMILPDMISTMTFCVVIAAGLLYISPFMALIMMMTIPLAILCLAGARSIMNRQGRGLYDASSRLADGLVEFVSGIKFIKSFNISSRKLDNLISMMKDFRDRSLRTEGTLSPVMVVSGICIDLGLVTLILSGAFFMENRSLDGRAFLLFLLLSTRFFESLKSLSVDYVRVRYLGIAGDSILSILKEPLPVGYGRSAAMGDYSVEYRNVSFHYENHIVLEEINTFLREKTVTAIVGPSGAGKTTMVNLIGRLVEPAEGQVLVGGRSVMDMDPEELMRSVSMVFQNARLFNDTIFNNIMIGNPLADETQVIKVAERACCHEFISNLPDGYQTMVGENGSNLSGGEQQRISIARALLKNSPILLLDEATASLDPENEALVQKALTELLKDRTVIIIAHRLRTIKNADKILVLDNGRLVETGTHTSLMEAGGLYRRLWDIQETTAGWKMGNRSRDEGSL